MQQCEGFVGWLAMDNFKCAGNRDMDGDTIHAEHVLRIFRESRTPLEETILIKKLNTKFPNKQSLKSDFRLTKHNQIDRAQVLKVIEHLISEKKIDCKEIHFEDFTKKYYFPFFYPSSTTVLLSSQTSSTLPTFIPQATNIEKNSCTVTNSSTNTNFSISAKKQTRAKKTPSFSVPSISSSPICSSSPALCSSSPNLQFNSKVEELKLKLLKYESLEFEGISFSVYHTLI